jgi:hypothetical protein
LCSIASGSSMLIAIHVFYHKQRHEATALRVAGIRRPRNLYPTNRGVGMVGDKRRTGLPLFCPRLPAPRALAQNLRRRGETTASSQTFKCTNGPGLHRPSRWVYSLLAFADQGVRIMSLDEGDTLVAVKRVPHEEGEEA